MREEAREVTPVGEAGAGGPRSLRLRPAILSRWRRARRALAQAAESSVAGGSWCPPRAGAPAAPVRSHREKARGRTDFEYRT
jgi:hypothetical protein